ncbi:hypothetical protein PPSIR1_15010 [Plesiocystis pacifica SIR-1]|uniref:HTH tetR-type domain-containing protein n=1 Tax=Plesiocystis pacifica SIR-1 TaxID=391625 RepID=A6G6C9_9BACT|nr:TetR/AcrR family transcriptional regulator [Plesiocystis pacifica]EDM78558.1 hypothetical protein PPSIR1_15010 [Plesiocystis pacifica SIR-1]
MPKRIDDAAVFDAAMHVMLERGYAGATMSTIAELAEVSELTLFRKYGSKAQLLASAIEHGLSPMAEASFEPSGQLVEDLDRVVRVFVAANASRSRLLGLVMVESPRHPELVSVLRTPNRIIGKVAALVSHYQRAGELGLGEALDLVLALLGPLVVHSQLSHGNPELELAPLDLRWHVERFIHGHGGQP